MAVPSSGDFEGIEDEEEDTKLLEESRTEKDDGGFCTSHWKILLSGLGVVVMVSLGVVIGATVSPRYDTGSGHLGCAGSGNVRLPGNVVPLKYRLYIHPNITDGKFGYTGDVRILINVKSETEFIILHTKRLTVKKTMLHESKDIDNIDSSPKVSITESGECKKYEQLIIRLQKKIKASSLYVLHITFFGTISPLLDGFYRSSYKTNAGDTRYLATTFFEPAGARSAFPCFDEPAMKAKFKIIIVREKKHSTISNMPIIKQTERVQDGLVIDYFQESVKMSTYLVAFIVCDFGYKKTFTKRKTEIRVWAPKEIIDQTAFAIDVAPKVLEFYENFFGVNYPLPKLDCIGLPNFNAGGMENWGLITYRLTALLYKKGESSTGNKQWVAEVIAHEFGHQWFGNLVTLKWWNDLWLNEGFTNFMDIIGTDHVFPKWKMKDQMLLKMVQRSLVLDSHVNSHPISVAVDNPSQMAGIFDAISYDKGASLVRMMRDFLGAEAFHKGLKDYITKYKYANAGSDDLWKCLSIATGNKINVKKIMDSWTLQMGYPVVTISRKGNMAVATQEHFITDVVTKKLKKKLDYKWNIPLTYHFQNKKKKTRGWLHHDKDHFQFAWNSTSDGWLKVNCDQIGFYRVNYDQHNWDAIAAQLNTTHLAFSDGDRANLLDDAFQLAKAGKMTYVQALQLTPYLKNEKSYVPWVSGTSSIGYIGLMLKGLKEYKLYEKYILQLAVPHIQLLGWKDTGPHLDRFLRSSILHIAVKHNHTLSVKRAMRLFNDWKIYGTWIAPNLRSTVYLAGIKYGGESDWNFMFQKYETSQVASEKKKLMYALTETSNATILKKYLEMSLNGTVVKSGNSLTVIYMIARNPSNGQKMAIDFIKKHWQTIYDRYARVSFSMGRMIKHVFGQFKTTEGLKEAEKFIVGRDLGSGNREGKQSLAIINTNINWLKRNKLGVAEWLRNHID